MLDFCDVKISVIVCCYNVSKWLKLGRLENIYKQTYNNWELVLIDDGSTDDTGYILDIEQKKEKRIKLVHTKNQGLGAARNLGIELSTGKYICAYDVDDTIDEHLFEYCVEQMESKQIDVLMYGFEVFTPNSVLSEHVQLKEAFIQSNEDLKKKYIDHILLVRHGNGFFVNKCYRKSFLTDNNITFENQRIQQDEAFNLKVYEYLTKCYISPRILYQYYIYNEGNNRSNFYSDRYDIYKSIYKRFRHLQHFWNLNDSIFEDYLLRRFFSNVVQCLTYNLFHKNCTWITAEKKAEIERIMLDDDVRLAIAHCLSQKLSIKERLYIQAFKGKSLFGIKTLYILFELPRNIRQIFR